MSFWEVIRLSITKCYITLGGSTIGILNQEAVGIPGGIYNRDNENAQEIMKMRAMAYGFRQSVVRICYKNQTPHSKPPKAPHIPHLPPNYIRFQNLIKIHEKTFPFSN